MERYSIESSGQKGKAGGKGVGKKLGTAAIVSGNATYLVGGAILLISLAGTGFFGFRTFALVRDNRKLRDENKALQQQLGAIHQSSTIKSNPAAANTPAGKASQSQKDSIQAALNTKNLTAIKPFLAPGVLVVRAGGTSLSAQTPEQVINELAFLAGAAPPWIIVSGATLTNWQNGAFGSFFGAGTIVFQSSNNYVVSFDFTPDGQIDTVFMTNDAGVLSQSAGSTGDNAPVSQPNSASGSE